MSSRTPRRSTRWPSGSRTSSRGTTGSRASISDQLLARAERGHEGGELAAAGVGLEPLGRECRHRPRRRLVERRQRRDLCADCRDRRRRGEQEDRQGHGQARLPGRERGPRRLIPAGSRTRSSAASPGPQPDARGAVPLHRTHVTSADFVTYPILRFKDAPKVTPIVIQWSSRPSRPASASPSRWPPPPPSRTRSSTRPACGCERALHAGPGPRGAKGRRRGVSEPLT